MLITIELENAIDHLFRGEELLPSVSPKASSFFQNPFTSIPPILTVILTADIAALCCFPSRPHSCIPRLMKK